jgi:hypothetical protein
MAKKKKSAQVSNGLPPNYLRSLELLESGGLTSAEIAKACNIPIAKYTDLIDGRHNKWGLLGDLFASELKQVANRTAERVRFLAKDCTKLALQKLSEHLRMIQRDDMSDDNLKKLLAVVTALGKTMPKIEIGQMNVQNNVYQGFTPFELYNEYKRLTNVARALSERRGLPGASAGGSGEIPESADGRSEVPEEPEAA